MCENLHICLFVGVKSYRKKRKAGEIPSAAFRHTEKKAIYFTKLI